MSTTCVCLTSDEGVLEVPEEASLVRQAPCIAAAKIAP